ncbi:hypothetical protein CONLIGDRAFT_638340 [Coniochaeta ligniaria NRRL 30616]|uniref:BZIP domain-containing protein n=1 Tax=Coniochaeta ligniaria NRRL 30616 TaxID=1408157 RepID=A0A1J7I4M2_9PEZI|nr:hypothetical protein CONLIGDRAFT_638340 [Coniochaeta ligniaria NRRL 30616]
MISAHGSTDKLASGATLSAQLAKKPISADRRLQNRKAQKAYRDRKRERLRELESKLATLQSASVTVSPAGQLGSTLSSIPTAQILASEVSDVSRIRHPYQQPLPESLPDAVYTLNGWDNLSLWPSVMSPEINLLSTNAGDRETNLAEEVFGLLDSPGIHTPDHLQSSSISPASIVPLQRQHAESTQSRRHTEATRASAFSEPTDSKSLHIYRPSGRQFATTPRLVREHFLSLPKSTQRRLYQLAKDGDFSFVDVVQSLLQVTNDDVHAARQSEQLLPVVQASVDTEAYSPYRNVLRIARFSYFAALFANFSCLGFNFSAFLDENSVSPFCGRPDDDTNDVDIPSSLRPLPSQRTISHHPYIDSLPFPSFRRRALAALSTDPPLLDEDDLCIDLMLKDGLVCWGSTGQNGSDHGTPWDSRSWEAKEWFLRKWWWLVGGQDGELYVSSRWWASQRGERISLRGL